ncbi:MAG: RNA-binding protein, partial [Gammaproteobacteria bacterium]
MANKGLFQSKIQRPPKAEAQREAADALNEAGGLAYRPSARQALAQYAVTGCLNATYYADAATQLDTVLALCAEVGPEFVAKTAIYARRQGFMKDMPALLCAWLAAHGAMVLPQAFGRVIDNGKMLRNFVQMLRSGAVGRKSLGSMPKRLVQEWLHRRSVEQLLADSVGQSPSLADVIKMVHPKPVDQARAALYAYLIGKPCEVGLLPAVVQDYLAFKANPGLEVPNVPFQWLTALDLQPRHWVGIACQAQWQMTRMNLNAFARHGVFQVGGMKQRIAARLRDRDAIRNARAFPYQLLCAYTQAADGVPAEVT